MAADKWQNYQQFLVTLELTIEQQQSQLNLWEQRVSDANRHWQEKQQRVNAFDTLIRRADHAKNQRQNRLEQKQMDEFAQRATLWRTR
ncbi:Flagellar fliJ protein [Morganella morganii]|nr:Flagellar fliJ protein [Morganella morganii]